jgi:hypothetical protein
MNALHAAQHGQATAKSVRDLDAALESADAAGWRVAAELARRLRAEPAFAAGLRLVPAGADLAADLRLPREQTVSLALDVTSAPRRARTLARFMALPGLRAKLAFLARRLVPPPSYMRALFPLARQGRLGLTGAYVWRLVLIVFDLPRAVRAWTRARRAGAPSL